MDDQDLLTRFSCMGTQDRDVLVSELHDILGSQLSREGCVFFLEMSNWNLQAAVGAYYDFYGQSDLQPPQVCVVKDFSVNEGGPVPPLTPFTKTWRIKNAGSYPWPVGSYISHWSGHTLGAVSATVLPTLGPGEEANVSVSLTSPNTAGFFQSQWKMFTSSGAMCGGTLFVTVIVEDSTVMGVTEQLSTISTNEGDMDTGGGAVGGASLLGSPEKTIEQKNPFANPTLSPTVHFNQAPDLLNFVPNSTVSVGTNSDTMATGIDASSRRLLGNSPSELSTLVTTLTDSIHTRLPNTGFSMSDSNSTQKNGNGSSTEQQDCSSMMTSEDFGAGNIYPS